jgi:hypothetical protein
MLHVFIGEILANMTQVSDVAPGPLVSLTRVVVVAVLLIAVRPDPVEITNLK